MHGNKYLHKKGLAPKAIHAIIVATLRKNVTSYATVKQELCQAGHYTLVASNKMLHIMLLLYNSELRI